MYKPKQVYNKSLATLRKSGIRDVICHAEPHRKLISVVLENGDNVTHRFRVGERYLLNDEIWAMLTPDEQNCFSDYQLLKLQDEQDDEEEDKQGAGRDQPGKSGQCFFSHVENLCRSSSALHRIAT